jgi:hypothetical protein
MRLRRGNFSPLARTHAHAALTELFDRVGRPGQATWMSLAAVALPRVSVAFFLIETGEAFDFW